MGVLHGLCCGVFLLGVLRVIWVVLFFLFSGLGVL